MRRKGRVEEVVPTRAKGRGQPSETALSTPLAERLNHIRGQLGLKSTREFHRLLTARQPIDREPYRASYEATRTYFQGRVMRKVAGRVVYHDRDAPVHYLTRVLLIFPEVNPLWLFTGVGQPFSQPQPRVPFGDVTKTIAAAFPAFRIANRTAQEGAAQAWRAVRMHMAAQDPGYIEQLGRLDQNEEWPPEIAAVAVAMDENAAVVVGRALQAPLRELAVDVRSLRASQLDGYVSAFALAVSALFPAAERYDATIGTVAVAEDLNPKET